MLKGLGLNAKGPVMPGVGRVMLVEAGGAGTGAAVAGGVACAGIVVWARAGGTRHVAATATVAEAELVRISRICLPDDIKSIRRKAKFCRGDI